MDYSVADQEQIILKITYKDITKRQRTGFLTNFSQLQNIILKAFPELQSQNTDFSISYIDPDSDLILINSEADWSEAIKCVHESLTNILKITIQEKPLQSKIHIKPSTINIKNQLQEIISELAKEESRKFQDSIRILIEEELKKSIQNLQPKLEKPVTNSQIIHKNITCDACNIEPIIGNRYKCTECADYDLCEKCESQGIHSHHLFLKISTPEQAPISILTQPENNVFIPQISTSEIIRGVRKFGRAMCRSNLCGHASLYKKGKKNMGIIKSDKIVKLAGGPNEILCAQWKIRNESENPWPSSLFIDLKKGSIEFEKILISDKIESGQKEMTLNVPIKAPNSIGLHKIVLYLHDEKGDWIGEKLKVHLNVISKEMKTNMLNTDYFKASQLNNQGFGTFEKCLSEIRKCKGDLELARNNLKKL